METLEKKKIDDCKKKEEKSPKEAKDEARIRELKKQFEQLRLRELEERAKREAYLKELENKERGWRKGAKGRRSRRENCVRWGFVQRGTDGLSNKAATDVRLEDTLFLINNLGLASNMNVVQ